MENREKNWLAVEETTERARVSIKEVAEFLDTSEKETQRLLTKRKVAMALNENIEDKIRFENPIVWMNYLRKTRPEIQTVGDFVNYVQKAKDGSDRRFDLLNNELKSVFDGADLTNFQTFPADNALEEFIENKILLGVYMRPEFSSRWQDNEYKAQTDFPGEVVVNDEVA
jgi:hypothetical protein